MSKVRGVLSGHSSHKVIIDDLHNQAMNPNFEEIQKLKHNIFHCQHDVTLFTEYIRFKNDKDKWVKLIELNLGHIKECQIRIALLGG